MTNQFIAMIQKMMPPPVMPEDAAISSAWADTIESLGTELPDDYKSFIQSYGSGSINEFLFIFNANSRGPFSSLLERSRSGIRVDRELRNFDRELITWPIFPESKGWLPWGRTINGNSLYWITDGKPNNWKIAVSLYDPVKAEIFPESFASFLEGILSLRIRCRLLGSYFPGDEIAKFIPL